MPCCTHVHYMAKSSPNHHTYTPDQHPIPDLILISCFTSLHCSGKTFVRRILLPKDSYAFATWLCGSDLSATRAFMRPGAVSALARPKGFH